MGHLSTGNHGLGGSTSGVHAGAAQMLLLNQGHGPAVIGQFLGERIACLPGTDHDSVIARHQNHPFACKALCSSDSSNASTSTVMKTSSLTTTPRFSKSPFQLTWKSRRLMRVSPTKPTRAIGPASPASVQYGVRHLPR